MEAPKQLRVLQNAWHAAAHGSGAGGAMLANAHPCRALDILPWVLLYTTLIGPDVHDHAAMQVAVSPTLVKRQQKAHSVMI